MINIGKNEKLKIKKIIEIGAYLENDDRDEILLPKKQVPKSAKVGDILEVFLYNDSKGRPIATTKEPIIKVGETGRLVCVDVNNVGAFLNIGLERDVLLPFAEQTHKVKKGDYVDVVLYLDKSKRICASQKLKKHISSKKLDIDYLKEREYEENAKKVYKIMMNKYSGHLLKTDKEITPEETKEIFGLSKKHFKDAIGKLLKEDKIKITAKGIYCY